MITGRDGAAAVRVAGMAAGPGRRRPPGRPARDLGQPRPRPPANGATARCSQSALPAGNRPAGQPQGAVAAPDAARRRARGPGRRPRSWPTRSRQRDLTGARDIPAVIDARIRRRHGDLVPLPAPSWSAQVPETADPERRRFLTQLAAAMDDRRRRIGEHAAASSLPWAVAALGAAPEDPAARLALAEQGRRDRRLPRAVRPRPPRRPDRPRARHRQPGPARRLARGPRRPQPSTRPDVRHLTDGQLLNLRDTYPRTAWAPAVGRHSSARPAPPPATPTWQRSAPTPKPAPPAAAASTTRQPGRRRWPRATRQCATPTAHARPSSTKRWTTATTGNERPAISDSYRSRQPAGRQGHR